MNDRESVYSSSQGSEPNGVVEQLLAWCHRHDADEHYLAAATDHADLERRMRVLDRASCAPLFVTFNH